MAVNARAVRPPKREGVDVRVAVSLDIELDAEGHIQTTLGRDGDASDDHLGYIKALSRGIETLQEHGLKDAVRSAREARMTWEEIGQALGVTRQSAWEKYWVD